MRTTRIRAALDRAGSAVTRRVRLRGRMLMALCLSRVAPEEVLDEVRVGRHRFRMSLRPSEPVEFHIHYVGVWERDETRLFTSRVQPGATVLDVGANVGYYSLLAASCAGPGGTVHSFEPGPATHARLQRNLALNPGLAVHTHAVALAELEGTSHLFFHPGGDAGSASMAPYPRDVGRVEIATTTLDAFLDHAGVARPDFVKVDIEGAEPRVLQGAARLLARQDAPEWMLEVNPERLASSGFTPADVLGPLHRAGYTVYRLARGGTLVPLGTGAPGGGMYTVFARKERGPRQAPS